MLHRKTHPTSEQVSIPNSEPLAWSSFCARYARRPVADPIYPTSVLLGCNAWGIELILQLYQVSFLREIARTKSFFGRAWQDHCLQTSGKFAYCRSWASFQVDGMMLCGLNLIPKSSLPIQSFHAHLSRRSTIISNVTSLWHAVADSNAWDVSTKQQDATGSKLYRLYIQ